MKLYNYDFKLLNNDGGIIEYKNKSTLDMVDIVNSHLSNKFNASSQNLQISSHTIYNLMNNRNTSKYLKIFITEITQKQIDSNGKILSSKVVN
mgnify:CR=1 FL=1|jgi:hypothetical protein